MTKLEFLKFHEEFCRTMHSICQAKNEDYTGSVDDPFFNFTRVERLNLVTTEEGFLVRMTDKMSRLIFFTQQEFQVSNETVQDSLLDLANYAILMAGYLKSKEDARHEIQKGEGEPFDGSHGSAVRIGTSGSFARLHSDS